MKAVSFAIIALILCFLCGCSDTVYTETLTVTDTGGKVVFSREVAYHSIHETGNNMWLTWDYTDGSEGGMMLKPGWVAEAKRD